LNLILTEKEETVKLLPKQHGFLFCNAKEVMYDGAFGAGKTRILCYKAVQKALHKGNRVGLFRKTLTSLKATTLQVLLEKDGNLPPVLPKGSYIHNKSDHVIKVREGGEIYYSGLDDPLRIASLNLGTACVDEAREMDKDEYHMLLGRLRNTADPQRQICLATNPDSPSHFLFERFYREKDNTRAVFKSKSTDNFFLPQDYIDMLSKFSGQYRDRFVLGKWVAFEGLIYDNFDRDTHLVHRDLSEFQWFLLAIDEGYSDPAVCGLFGIDSDNRMHLIKMFYKRKVLPSQFVKVVKYYGMAQIMTLRPKDVKLTEWEIPHREFVFDPSAAGLIADCEKEGLPVYKANNAVFDGTQAVRDRLSVDETGKPFLTIEKDGEGVDDWLTEVESYHLDKNEKPAKGLDHAMDMTRYAAMHMKEKVEAHVQALVERTQKKLTGNEQLSEKELENRIYERSDAWV